MQFSLRALLVLTAYLAASTQLFLWFEEPGLFYILLVAAAIMIAIGWLKRRRGILIGGIVGLVIVVAMAPLLLTVAVGNGRSQVEILVKVVDSDTRRPIAFARVEIEGGAFGASLSSSTLSNNKGIAWFTSEFPWSSRTGLLIERAFVYAGGHALRIDADGYRPIEAMFYAYTNATWPLNSTRAPDIVVPLERVDFTETQTSLPEP